MRASVLKGPQSVEIVEGGACLYTVSIDPTGNRDKNILAGREWVMRRFSIVRCRIGDGPLIERTSQITGVPIQVVQRRIDGLLARMPGAELMSALARQKAFREALDEVAAAMVVPDFANAVEVDAIAYVDRVRRRQELALPEAKAIKLSRDYILHEVAMYLCEAREGFLVDAYVGQELPVLRKFISGDITGILSPLERRAFISLKLEDL